MAAFFRNPKDEAPNVVEHAEASGKSLSQANCDSPWAEEQEVLEQSCRYFWDASQHGQRARLLDVLAVTTVTPLEAKENLEIDRIHEHVDALRQANYNIQATLFWTTCAEGQRKCSVRYELQDGPYLPWGVLPLIRRVGAPGHTIPDWESNHG